jgi:hypothetical protein
MYSIALQCSDCMVQQATIFLSAFIFRFLSVRFVTASTGTLGPHSLGHQGLGLSREWSAIFAIDAENSFLNVSARTTVKFSKLSH